MRKFILAICLFIVAIAASAQTITATGGKLYTGFTGVDYIFMFNGIDNSTLIEYSGSETDIKWCKFADITHSNPVSNQTSFSPEDATGYTLVVNEKVIKTIWVIDYSKHKPILNDIGPENNPTDQCKNVNLKIDATVENLNYQTLNGDVHNLPREFEIKYTTLKWGGTSWQPTDTTVTLNLPENIKNVPAPFCKTTYTLSGDQYAKDLGLVIQKESAQYTPVAVICHPTSITTIRTATNEADRPSTITKIEGSGPLDIQFFANANDPIPTFYKWEIFKDKKLFSTNVGPTNVDYRFNFTETGVYNVKVTVNNNTCSYTDSTITVTVSESQIKVPNVFTPNGDGYNDEFRVAYKSIISFHCWVYNRWGRLVYEWTDPQKGWDGKIGGKDASPGAYFYIINALGSDARKYKLKGDINLLRGTGN